MRLAAGERTALEQRHRKGADVCLMLDDKRQSSGRLNKQVGGVLNISEITVKAHRGKMMRKMRERSLAQLVNIAARLDLQTANSE